MARADDEEQAIGTFYNSHGEVEELAKPLNAVLRTPQMAPPRFVANSATNSLTVRTTTSVLGILEQVIAANDTPAGGDHHRRRGGASGAWTTTPSSTTSPSRMRRAYTRP